MPTNLDRLVPQPLIGIATMVVALMAIAASSNWDASSLTQQGTMWITFVTLYLVLAVVLAHRFPIHIRHHTKIHVSSTALYLIAVLLPPPLAAIAAGVGTLCGGVMVRSQRGTYPSDIATQTGRYVVVVLLGSVAAHLPVDRSPLQVLSLFGALVVLLAGDVLTAPLLFAPRCKERPLRIMIALVREGGIAEAVQYFMGVLIALAAIQAIWALALLAIPTVLIYATLKRAKELDNGTRQLLENMADTVDLRDPYTGGHSRRVTELTHGILAELGMRGPDVDLIISAARVHDIGKIGIPDQVLNKPGKLTPEEWAIMQTHPERGAELLQRYPSFARGVEIVRHHHERWDGAGYPHRLKGTEIPFGARVIAVADSFDAMTSDRPYRRGFTVEKAAAILREGRGIQWDPALVDAFLRSIADQLEQPVAAPLLRLVDELWPASRAATTA